MLLHLQLKGSSRPRISGRPKYQTEIVLFSIFSLLVYFTVLREENDVDGRIRGEDIYEQYPELEEVHLRLSLERLNPQSEEADAIRRRLAEIVKERNEKK